MRRVAEFKKKNGHKNQKTMYIQNMNISQWTLNIFCEVITCARIGTVGLHYKIMKVTEYFVTL